VKEKIYLLKGTKEGTKKERIEWSRYNRGWGGSKYWMPIFCDF